MDRPGGASLFPATFEGGASTRRRRPATARPRTNPWKARRSNAARASRKVLVRRMQDLDDHFDTLRTTSSRRPAVDRRSYRDAMASIGATVGLATARLGDERIGRTVTSYFSLSLEPPAILVSIDRESRLAECIAATAGFSFAMLADGQQPVADAFAGAADPAERFRHGRWTAWKSGHPRLEDTLVTMDCEVIGVIETATHRLVAGCVVDIETSGDRAPLIWHRRRYHGLEA
ncbi:flavin reductase family protein [Jiella avicenniae]|uniref:Flavin reductase family protein n=1 Tax=Jiella avicenniae TaxID=2907202 RepID=A0A9X1P208_9HYPH|nr:flavin reductase family protein [Jiella avicenniae]MCE7029597.1 flavin reductase family protein [Jiella avicenniae]